MNYHNTAKMLLLTSTNKLHILKAPLVFRTLSGCFLSYFIHYTFQELKSLILIVSYICEESIGPNNL